MAKKKTAKMKTAKKAERRPQRRPSAGSVWRAIHIQAPQPRGRGKAGNQREHDVGRSLLDGSAAEVEDEEEARPRRPRGLTPLSNSPPAMYFLENPVLQRELLVNLRMGRAFVLLFLYQALLGLRSVYSPGRRTGSST